MIGCDIIEVERVKKLKFKNKVFTDKEIQYANKYSKPYIHLAGFFALKEAIIKAMDIPLNVCQIEILHNEKGAPIANILVELTAEYDIQCSISNLEHLAMAVAFVQKIN